MTPTQKRTRQRRQIIAVGAAGAFLLLAFGGRRKAHASQRPAPVYTAAPGSPQLMGIAPDAVRGFIEVLAQPNGQVRINNQDTAHTTPTGSIPLPAGQHQVQVRFPSGTLSDNRTVTVRSGATTTVRLMEPASTGQRPRSFGSMEPCNPSLPRSDQNCDWSYLRGSLRNRINETLDRLRVAGDIPRTAPRVASSPSMTQIEHIYDVLQRQGMAPHQRGHRHWMSEWIYVMRQNRPQTYDRPLADATARAWLDSYGS